MADPNELADALLRTPELRNAPALATAAFQAPTDTLGTAQTLAAVSNQKAQSDAAAQVAEHHGGKSMWGKAFGFLGEVVNPIVHPLGEAVGGALHIAGAPLREVQHQYRYLHDVEARHGPLAAILQGIPIVAAGAVGSLLGPEGTVLAGEAVAGLEGRVLHTDSWDRTTDGEAYLDPSGHKVSIGRDLGHVLHLKEGSKPFTWVSGASDMLADFAADPIAKVGKMNAAARGSAVEAEEGLGKLASRWGGLSYAREGDVDRAMEQYGSVKRAFDDIAGKSVGEIASSYPKLDGVFDQLGAATTREEVAQVFRDQLDAQSTLTDLLPTKSRIRTPLTAAAHSIQDWGGLFRKNLTYTEDVVDASGNVLHKAGDAMVDTTTGEQMKTLGLGARQIKKLTAKLPETWDRELGQFTGKEFALGTDSATRGVYMGARMGGMTRRAAEAAATEFAEATPDKQLTVWRNVMVKSLLQAGLPENGEAVSQMRQELVDMSGGATAGRTAKFGYNPLGEDVGQIELPNGSKTAAAITLSQEGKVSFPNYNAVKNQIRDLHVLSKHLGKFDDWVYYNYTQSIFKKMVLLSGGFATRVAMGELVPRGLADGFHNIFNAGIAANVARYEGMIPDEMTHLQKATAWVMRGVEKINPGISAEDVDFYTKHVDSMGGHIVSHGLMGGHNYGDEVMGVAEKQLQNIYKETNEIPMFKRGDFRAFDATHNDQPLAWHEWIGEQASDPMHQSAAKAYSAALKGGATEVEATMKAQQAAKETLDNITAGKISDISPKRLQPFIRHGTSGTPGLTPHEDWANVIVENLKGAVHQGDTGNVHMDILDSIASGEGTPIKDLEAVHPDLRPKLTKGQELNPMWGTKNLTERVANFGFERVLNPTINKLSREPLYALESKKQFDVLKPLLERGMTEDEALAIAHTRAGAEMTRYVHNIAERTQFAEGWRNMMPFFFAQQQAWARSARLLAENPGAFRQFQLMSSMIHDAGHVVTDADGQQHLVYPGSGFLGNKVPGIFARVLGVNMAGSVPVGITGNVKSLASAFPLSEQELSFGPLVSLPLNALRAKFPELTPAVQGILGEAGSNADVISQLLLPNTTLRRSYEALTQGEHNRSFANAEIAIVQNLSYQQEQAMDKWRLANPGKPDDDPTAPQIVPGATAGPVEQQKFIDRVKNQTRVLMMTKAIIGAVSPMAPALNIGEVGMQDELQKLIDAKGYSVGTAEFLHKHPDATPYTVYKTSTNTNSPLSATSEAGKFMDENGSLLASHPYAAAWFIPQSKGAFDSAVYNEQLALNLRHRKSPDQVYKDIYTAIGNNQYFDVDKPAYDKKYQELKDAGDAMGLQALKSNWSQYQDQFRKQNPIWAASIQSGERGVQRTQAVEQLRDIFEKGLAPPGQQSDDLKELLNDWDTFNASLVPGNGSNATAQRKRMKAKWESYLKQQSKDKPNLSGVIQRVFSNLDPEIPTTAPTA